MKHAFSKISAVLFGLLFFNKIRLEQNFERQNHFAILFDVYR